MHARVEDGELRERFAQGEELARGGQAEGDAAGEAFDIDEFNMEVRTAYRYLRFSGSWTITGASAVWTSASRVWTATMSSGVV